jgi:hypothetical protein
MMLLALAVAESCEELWLLQQAVQLLLIQLSRAHRQQHSNSTAQHNTSSRCCMSSGTCIIESRTRVNIDRSWL